MKIVVKLRNVLRDRHMTQKELAQKVGIREGTISDIANDSRTSINKEHLAKIADSLGIRDIRELIDFEA